MNDRLKAYARAGVDVDLGNKVKAGLPKLLKSAHRPEVLGKVGGFVGLPSSGLHTNGFSLAREILFNQLGCRLEERTHGFRGSLGEELLRTHTLYLPHIRKVRAQLKIKGIAHITGGGLMDNIPRIL